MPATAAQQYYQPYGGSPSPGYGSARPPTQAPYNVNPTYLQDVLNYQNLMSNPALLYGVPQVNPMMLNPTAYTGAVTSAMSPIFRQQDRGLTASLADAGIVGGPTQGAVTNLANTQNQQLAGQIAPMIQQIMQGNQATQLAGQEANQATGLQGGEFNANTQNQAQQFDINNLINAGQFDANAANQFLGQGMGYQNQDWLSQMGALASMFQAMGQSVSGAFQPIFQQPGQENWGAIGEGIGGMFPPPSSGAPSYPPIGAGYQPEPYYPPVNYPGGLPMPPGPFNGGY